MYTFGIFVFEVRSVNIGRSYFINPLMHFFQTSAMAIFCETDLGTKSKYAVTELSSGKYVTESLGLVTLRLGLGLGLGLG